MAVDDSIIPTGCMVLLFVDNVAYHKSAKLRRRLPGGTTAS